MAICIAIIISAMVFAQAPQSFSYQAVIRNSSNQLINNQQVQVRISILQGNESGDVVFSEIHIPSTNNNGLFTIQVGSGTNISGSINNINWANGPYFIRSETDPNGGNVYTLTTTTQMMSVPYALYAENAGNTNGGGYFTHYIGEEFGSGVIFHLWKDAQGEEHGLIIDKTDLSTAQLWSNIDTLIGASAQSIWDGLSNSNAIVGQTGHINSAASLCLNSNNGGQSDWYLPSIQELNMLWNNYYTVARSLSQISGASQMQLAFYWSSVEHIGNFPWFFNFASGYPNIANGKSLPNHVRAVRAF
jgi:hypothetical protein